MKIINKKGEEKSGASTITGILIAIVLIIVISTFLRAEPIYDCFDESYPELNSTDKICYNATGVNGSVVDGINSTRISMSVTESLLAGVMIILLVIGLVLSVKPKTK